MVVQGQLGFPLRRSWVRDQKDIWFIGNSYIASEHPEAEYKYLGVFVALTDHQARGRDLNNIHFQHLDRFCFNITPYIRVFLDSFSIQSDRAQNICLPLEYFYPHNGILLFSKLQRQMSSTITLTPSKLLEYYTTAKIRELLDQPTEPHPDIIWNSFKQVLLAEPKQETFTETFYHWVNTVLTTEDLETLYTDLEDEYFQYEPPSDEDHEDEWAEISTQKSRRKWLRIWDNR